VASPHALPPAEAAPDTEPGAAGGPSPRHGWKAALVVLVLAELALAAFLGSRIGGLRIRVQDLELLPTDSAVLAADDRIRETFGSDERLIVGLESRDSTVGDPAFREDFAFFVGEIVASRNLRMLFLDRLYRPRYRAGAVAGEPYLLHAPDRAWIERALAASPLTARLAAGRSRRVAFAELAALSPGGVRSIEERVRQAFARLEERRPGRYALHVVGRQVVLNSLGTAVLEDLRRMLPWSFAVMFALLLLIFRSLTPAVVALCEVGMSVTCTMGVLRLLGHDLSLMTALVPVLITVLGIADEIHLFGELYRLKALHPLLPAPALARQALANVFFPVTATALTTSLGFFSFLVPDVPALRVFGLTAGIGVCFSWFFTTTLVPALLALVPTGSGPRWTQRPRLKLPPALFRGAVPVVLSALAIPGLFRLQIDDGWTRNFRPDHPVVADERWFRAESVGLHPFDVLLARTDGRRWSEPALLAALARLTARIEGLPVAKATISLADLVRDRAWELGDPGADRPAVPASSAEIETILRSFRLFNEEVFLRSFLDATGTKTRLVVFSASDDYATSSRARAALDRLVREAFGREVEVAVGGSAERGRVLVGAVVSNQAQSVTASLLLGWLALGFASRRWGRALRCVLANAWALTLVLGLAGWAGITLGVASSCFLALGVGTGLDYAIHLAFHHGRQGVGDEGAREVVQLRVLADVLAVGVGLAVLTLSANPTVSKLGLLIVASLVACGYAALVFFPAGERR
jgi:uncharacterized protein